jgi:hypothetical protein
MTRLFREVVYWLAMTAGILGLVAGGKSLVKYALARFNDPYFDSFSYNDLVFSGGVIFLLSLILLIFADLARTLGGAFPPAKPESPGASPKPTLGAPRTAAPSGPAPETEPDRESADEKLARLLKQKKE